MATDDKYFLRYLRSIGRLGVPPVGVMIEMCDDGNLSKENGLVALDRMRNSIPEEEYQEGFVYFS